MAKFGDEVTKVEGYITTKVAALSSMGALLLGFGLGFLVKAIF